MDGELKKTIRLMISNQKGGVAKTTTAITLARYAADQGMSVLLIDTDPQSSIAEVLGQEIKPERTIHNFLVENLALRDCVVEPHPRIHLLASTRRTSTTEAMLMNRPGKELIFEIMMPSVEADYDLVLIDVAPSINLFQTAGMIYAEKLLIPVMMDLLSLQGANSSINTAVQLSSWFKKSIRPVALLPVMVDKRYQMTQTIMGSVNKLAEEFGIPVLHEVRTDATANKAARMGRFIVDFDSNAKIVQDYDLAFAELFKVLKGTVDAEQKPVEAR